MAVGDRSAERAVPHKLRFSGRLHVAINRIWTLSVDALRVEDSAMYPSISGEATYAVVQMVALFFTAMAAFVSWFMLPRG